MRSVPAAALTRSDGAGWTMQENAGHLLDLESLISGRLDDFDAGAETLRPADMSNRKTHEANHNAAEIESILAAFRREREEIMQRLEALEPAGFARTALHPRLKKPMRLVDMLYFQAEHDVYHLTRISQLARKFKN